MRRVKIARYPVTGFYDARAVGRPSALDAMEADGWIPLVTVRDTAAAVWVLYRERERDQTITDLLAITLADEDIVLTKVSGDLTSLVLDAVAVGRNGEIFGDAFAETGLFEPDGDHEGQDRDLEDPDLRL